MSRDSWGRAAAGAVLSLCLLAPAAGRTIAADAATERTVIGTLQVFVEDDFARSRWRRSYAVTEPGGAGYVPLRLTAAPAVALTTGATVRVRGRERDGRLTLDAADGSALQVLAPAATIRGERRVVVLLVDLSDAAVACSDDSVAGLMFRGARSVAGLYAETSYGGVQLPDDTDGDGAADVFRVSIAALGAGSCDPQGWANQADAVAAPRVDLAAYQHRLYVLPASTGCSWAGLANVGCGSFCRSWVTTCGLPDVYAHELGHNLGMAHASTDDDHDGAVDSEYGDRSDFMGIGGVGYRHLNAPHKQQLGWLSASQVIEAEVGAASYVLSPLHVDPVEAIYPQLLQIRRPRGGDDYYVSYRRRVGYDSDLSSSYADRASVHTYRGSGPFNTLFVGALDDGAELSDPAGGVRITQLAHDADAVTVLVEVEADCLATAPQVELSPAVGLGRPAERVDYAVSLTNRDAAACPAATFTLSPQPPGGWTSEVEPSTLTLAPGERATARLRIGAAAGATDGEYSVRLAVRHPDDPSAETIGAATFTVDGTPPPPVDGLRASARSGDRVWLVWDGVWDGGVPVAGYRVYRDGLPVGTSELRRFLDEGLERGSRYEYRVAAVDAAGNESEPSEPAAVRTATREEDPPSWRPRRRP